MATCIYGSPGKNGTYWKLIQGRLVVIFIIIIIIKLALQHAHIKLRIMTCASTITLCMLEGMLASSASTLKVYNVH